METQAFILGALSVIGVACVTLVVVGTVKIYKLIKKDKFLSQELNETRSNIYQSISDENRYIQQRLNEMDRVAEHQIEAIKRDITSYVDSRIDKLQSKTKEVIKG